MECPLVTNLLCVEHTHTQYTRSTHAYIHVLTYGAYIQMLTCGEHLRNCMFDTPLTHPPTQDSIFVTHQRTKSNRVHCTLRREGRDRDPS